MDSCLLEVDYLPRVDEIAIMRVNSSLFMIYFQLNTVSVRYYLTEFEVNLRTRLLKEVE